MKTVQIPRQLLKNLTNNDAVCYNKCIEFLHIVLSDCNIHLELVNTPTIYYKIDGKLDVNKSTKYSKLLVFLLQEFIANLMVN